MRSSSSSNSMSSLSSRRLLMAAVTSLASTIVVFLTVFVAVARIGNNNNNNDNTPTSSSYIRIDKRRHHPQQREKMWWTTEAASPFLFANNRDPRDSSGDEGDDDLFVQQQRGDGNKYSQEQKRQQPQSATNEFGRYGYPDLSFLLRSRESAAVENDSNLFPPLPRPIWVMERYREWHSVESLLRTSAAAAAAQEEELGEKSRRYAVGFYQCPISAGNRLHEFMNGTRKNTVAAAQRFHLALRIIAFVANTRAYSSNAIIFVVVDEPPVLVDCSMHFLQICCTRY